MKNKWSCPLCGSKSWIRIKKKAWDKKIFPNRRLITCSNCRCSSMEPMITAEELEKINEVYWSKYQIIRDNSLNKPDNQQLSRVKFVRKFYAIEPDINMRQYLESKEIKKVYKSIFDVQENDFSLIIMSHVLEHLPNPREFLIHILNYMRNNALLFIEVPNRDDLYKRFLGLHTVVFNVSVFHKILNEIGYKIVKIITVGPSIHKLIAKNTFLSIFKDKIKKIFPKKIKHMIVIQLRNKIYNVIGNINRIGKKITRPVLLNKKYNMFDNYGKNRRYIRILAQKKV